jgi:hypothetical protein
MKKYGDSMSEFLSAERGSEEYVSLFYQLREFERGVSARTSPNGNYYLFKASTI